MSNIPPGYNEDGEFEGFSSREGFETHMTESGIHPDYWCDHEESLLVNEK